MNDKVQENRVRRKAERQGYVLRKSRRRDPNARDFGKYALFDPQGNYAVFGYSNDTVMNADLDDVEAWLDSPDVE